jgi:hypothetical protein
MITFAPGPKTYRSDISKATNRGMDEMSGIINEQEFMQHSNQPEPAGVSVFGHVQVDEAVRLVAAMLRQELRQFAEQLNAAQANHLFDALALVVCAPDTQSQS